MLKDHATTIANFLEVSLPEPNERGHYAFQFNKGLEISMTEAKNGDLVILAMIGEPLTNETKGEKIKSFLKWNLAILKDAEETLSWDPSSSQLVLYRQLKATELSERPLLSHLESFLNNLEFWNSAFKADPQDSQSFPLPT